MEEVHRALDAALRQDPPVEHGAVLLVLGRDGVLTRQFKGRTRADSRLPLLDASTWFSVAAVLTLVDQDGVGLDDPLGQWLPGLSGAGEGAEEKAAVTLRQVLAHTSGLVPQHPCLGDRDSSLAECAGAILAEPLRAPPGREVFFGNGALQVAGFLAETVSGKPWAEFFQDRVTDPLSLHCTSFGETSNPHLSRGARSCAEDLESFLQALLGGKGEDSTTALLTEETLAALWSPQSGRARRIYAPQAPGGYGLGLALARESPRVHSPGTFGPPFWLDPEAGLALVLLGGAPPERLGVIDLRLRDVLFGGV
jgi:CubicO group peptidase (beta-lactamase class C family)